MDCKAERIPYRQTNHFSKIALDYIDQSQQLRSFFLHPPSLNGIKNAIIAREKFPAAQISRDLLVKELQKQYATLPASSQVQKNIGSLLSPATFTVTTAHQGNIFTGPLYFIYKIVHAIKLADYLNTSLPANHFVPVFFIGSEDADLEELNHVQVNGEKLTWNTKQTGAVGRMKIDKDFLKLIDSIEGQLTVLPFGKEILSLVKDCYRLEDDIQTATFRMVNSLFAEYGLLVLLPDNGVLKKQAIAVFEDDLLHQTPSVIVEKTSAKLNESYKVQAHPREINLFYLLDDKRERIIKQGEIYKVNNTAIIFSEEQLSKELQEYPERFSPNVILRGIYQETILPNIAFIGGGGELAYWLELKDLFEHYQVPFPVLLLRNSFLIVEKKWQDLLNKLGFVNEDIFLSEPELINRLVQKEAGHAIKLNGTFTNTEQLYEAIREQAASIDATLGQHVEALKLKTLHRLQELEKKMLRAEKRKFTDQQRQIHTLKEHLFPGNGLQERYDNLLYYYAKWGKDFISKLYQHSLGLEQEFVLMQEN